MATRGTTRKEAPSKSTTTADTSAKKSAAPKAATDLISPRKKRTPSSEPRPSKSAIPPITRTRPREQATAQEAPPPPQPSPRPETVSLIDAKPEKKPSQPASGETRSVLPPISKFLPSIQPKAVEAEQKLAAPQPKPESSAPVAEPAQGGEKVIH